MRAAFLCFLFLLGSSAWAAGNSHPTCKAIAARAQKQVLGTAKGYGPLLRPVADALDALTAAEDDDKQLTWDKSHGAQDPEIDVKMADDRAADQKAMKAFCANYLGAQKEIAGYEQQLDDEDCSNAGSLGKAMDMALGEFTSGYQKACVPLNSPKGAVHSGPNQDEEILDGGSEGPAL